MGKISREDQTKPNNFQAGVVGSWKAGTQKDEGRVKVYEGVFGSGEDPNGKRGGGKKKSRRSRVKCLSPTRLKLIGKF